MKRAEFRTALIMVLIPLSVVLALEAVHATGPVAKIGLDLAAIIAFSISICLWLKVQSQITKEETEEKQEKTREYIDLQPLIAELRGLRQDINGLRTDLRNEETKHTEGKTTKRKLRNK